MFSKTDFDAQLNKKLAASCVFSHWFDLNNRGFLGLLCARATSRSKIILVLLSQLESLCVLIVQV